MQNNSFFFELAFGLIFPSLARKKGGPLITSISVFLKKDKLYSELKDELPLLIVHNKLDILAVLLNNPSVTSNRYLGLAVIDVIIHWAEWKALMLDAARYNVC